ncbi:MAG: 4-hydroxy-3-methylbut-2-enyl diphosphate reductase [Chloroflexi bacterium]|nr:4-hydroxy-3-methylbut-2-enyl diphosphate reductase [Chloroflexota bacterium]
MSAHTLLLTESRIAAGPYRAARRLIPGVGWSLAGSNVGGYDVEVLLSSPRGFCAGVVRAIDVVDICLRKYGPPVYVKHQIVHNPYVVNDLERRGAITVEELDEVPEGSLVIFSAHGSPPEDFEKAKARKLIVIDAVCPLVTKVHNEAKKYHREGKKVILVGHRGHQEVRGTMGQVEMTLFDDNSDNELSDWDSDQEVAVLTQTTLSVGDTAQAIESIREKFPDAVIRNDICYATTNRQDAVKKMAGSVDLVLVIGAENSSNCNRLREVAESLGVPSYLINGPEEIDPSWLDGKEKVGITSGASTPEVLVESVIAKLAPEKVTMLSGVDEDITFSLPKQLR